MSLSQLHNVYAVDYAGTVIRARDTSQNDGTQVIREANSGEPYARNAYLTAQNPTFEFTTPSIATALAAIGSLGAAIASGSTLVLYAQKRAEGGTRATGNSHRKYTINQGIVVPNQLSCDHQGNAQLSYSGLCTYDDSNNPVVIADDQALASLPATDDHFTLGAVSIGGTTLSAKTNVNVAFGVQVSAEGADSDIWPTSVSIEVVEAMITITTLDLALASIGLSGQAATHANTSVVFRKRAAGGTFAGSGDVTLTAAGLAVVDDRLRGAMGNPASGGVQIHCTYDGTNAPIAVS